MNPDGSVPADNPFPGSLVWAYGFRNGFGMDFDPSSGDLLASEAGPDQNDKIEFIVKGGNYCWPLWYTGGNTAGCQDSVLSFTPTVTPTGVAYGAPNTVYFGEYNTGNLEVIHFTPSGTVDSVNLVTTVGGPFAGVLSVQRGFDGDIYFSTTTTIYRIGQVRPLSLSTISANVIQAPGGTVTFVMPDFTGPQAYVRSKVRWCCCSAAHRLLCWRLHSRQVDERTV